MNTIDVTTNMIPIIIGMSIGFLIRQRSRRKSEEPEQDERTQKIAGKAAQSTLVVLMAAMAVVLWGEMLDVFKLQATPILSFMFFLMLMSLIVFRQYYKVKEV
jgi:uncharacterized membrane protein